MEGMKRRGVWIGWAALVVVAGLLGYFWYRYELAHREEIVIVNTEPEYELQFGPDKAKLDALVKEWGVWKNGIIQKEEGEGTKRARIERAG